MSDAAIAEHIVEALEATANAAGGGKTQLVSVSIEMLASCVDVEAQVSVARKTRTLLFLSAEVRSRDGARVASASSVHKVLG